VCLKRLLKGLFYEKILVVRQKFLHFFLHKKIAFFFDEKLKKHLKKIVFFQSFVENNRD